MEECFSEDRKMEVEALQSIYGELFTTFEGGDHDEIFHYEVNLMQSDIKIIFTIPEKYPEIPPAINVMAQNNQPAYTELESLLYSKAHESCGQVMIYDLVEEAKCWFLDKLNFVNPVSLPGEKEAVEVASTVCKFFLDGNCKFGKKCRNQHIELASARSGNDAESLHTNKNVKEDSTPKGKQKFVKQDNNVSTKKPSMKTASDVISRIKWDAELSPKDFTVGYLDRFVGIIEKHFEDFSWDDLASVDHFVDLAIPRHRIQYFKYLEEIVWDKRERIDKVFGSTGSQETILDVKQRINCASNEENDADCSDSKQVSVVDEMNCATNYIPEELQERRVPNYFIAVQISDEEVIDNIRKIQNDIYAELSPEAELELIASQGLHITLLMLSLCDEDQVTMAKSILRSVQPMLISILPISHKLCFSGLGQFHNKILYARIKDDTGLSKLLEILKFKFGKAGINLEANPDKFVPHVTISKGTSKDFATNQSVTRNVSNLVNRACYEIGEQSVYSLALFSRFHPKDIDGTYHKISTVENSVKALSSSLPRKLLQRVDHLYDQGELEEDNRDELEGFFQSGDAVKLDKGVTILSDLTTISDDKILLILRGVSGSGKTYLVENSMEAIEQKGYVYCSAKQLFHKPGCSVTPDITEQNIAEAYCFSLVLDALASEQCFVVVDGVHNNCWEYAIYKFLGPAFGYKCHVLEIKVEKREDIQSCLQNNKSGTQLEEILEAVQNWEDDPEAIVIEPWFNKPASTASNQRRIALKELLLRHASQ
ncbi:uncharacterized protein [Montipora capricornis]|uniref:uncharacterized protein n=1 Tax=Montipora capricornis TaxID=246305 RepID=UPI0035F21A64